MPEYILTLNSSQARALLRAIEFFIRIKMKQYGEIYEVAVPETVSLKDFCERRNEAEPLLRQAFDILVGNDFKKDDEWHRLYNMLQSLRYAVHECEHPETLGVDSYPPLRFGEEPISKCEWRKKNDET